MEPKKPDAHSRSDLWQEALRSTTLSWELALPIFGGVLIGYYVDRWLDMRPTFTLGLLMLGLGVSAYTLWRFIQRVEARQSGQVASDLAKPEGKER